MAVVGQYAVDAGAHLLGVGAQRLLAHVAFAVLAGGHAAVGEDEAGHRWRDGQGPQFHHGLPQWIADFAGSTLIGIGLKPVSR